jgi:2-methylcitrate dehydratase PrpD
MSTCAAVLARHVLDLRAQDVPDGIRRHAVTLITDVLGAGIYGAGTPQGQAIFAVARTQSGAGTAPVWGRGGAELDPAGAAFVNAAQAHAFEMDDYVPAGKTHPGTVIIPAALALAEESTTGEELITAVVAAYDVMVRVAYALNPNSIRARGFHITGVSGPLGAAAAAGRLLGLDHGQLTSALGIAGSCSAGIFAFSAEGAMTKPLHAGRAAEAGIMAARLAREGFEGPTAVLEAEDGGLLNAFSDEPRVGELTRGLGTRFDVESTAIKPYPCCGSIHSSIDAILALQRDHGLTPEQADLLTVHNAQGVLLQCGFPYTGEGGPLEAQMSLQYCLAAALVDGRVGLDQFSEDRRRDPGLIELASRVGFAVDSEIDAIYPGEFPARVTVQRTDGTVLESRIPAPLGTPANPIDAGGLREKFTDLTSTAMPSAARDRLLDSMLEIDSDRNLAEVIAIAQQASAPSVPSLEVPG